MPNASPISYQFSEREKVYFDRLQAQFNTSVLSGIQMIIAQQAFDGQWRIRADGSGLERVDVLADFQAPGSLPSA